MAITGAFFVIAQLIGFVVVFPDDIYITTVDVLTHFEKLLSNAHALSTSIASLLAALAIIFVFVIGLVLDLFAFPIVGMFTSFTRILFEQRCWLKPLLARHHRFLAEDARRILEQYKPAPTYIQMGKPGWYRRGIVDLLKHYRNRYLLVGRALDTLAASRAKIRRKSKSRFDASSL